MSAPTESPAEPSPTEWERRREHIEAYVGEVGKVQVWRRAASAEWTHVVSCRHCWFVPPGEMRPQGVRWRVDSSEAGEVIAAWLVHEADHDTAMRDRMARHAKGERVREDGQQNLRGISHLVAIALVVMELDVVRRTTIRALLPEGERRTVGGRRINVVSQASQGAYKRFGKAGWTTRVGTELIRVNDRESLFGWVVNSQDVDAERAMTMLRVGVAAKAAADEPVMPGETEQLAEVRRQELLALTRLMQRAPGGATNAHGRVRIVPKSSPL